MTDDSKKIFLPPDSSDGNLSVFAYHPVSPRRARLLTASSRLSKILSFWLDDKTYRKIVASGRFLKLSHATRCAYDNLEASARKSQIYNDGAEAKILNQARLDTSDLPASGEAAKQSSTH